MSYKRTVAPTLQTVSTTEAKDHLRIDHNDDDNYITNLVKSATSVAERYTQRSFMTQTWVKTLSKFPTKDFIEVLKSPVASITSISYYDADNAQQTFSNYTLVSPDIISYLQVNSDGWPSTCIRLDAVEVTFVTGYATSAELEDDIKHAILMIVGHLYENRQDVIVGSQVNKMPNSSKYLLEPYRMFYVTE